MGGQDDMLAQKVLTKLHSAVGSGRDERLAIRAPAACHLRMHSAFDMSGYEDAKTYDTSCVRAVCELAKCLSGLAVVDEDLGVRTNAGEVIPRWREANILDKLRVRLDRLCEHAESAMCATIRAHRRTDLVVLKWHT